MEEGEEEIEKEGRRRRSNRRGRNKSLKRLKVMPWVGSGLGLAWTSLCRRVAALAPVHRESLELCALSRESDLEETKRQQAEHKQQERNPTKTTLRRRVEQRREGNAMGEKRTGGS